LIATFKEEDEMNKSHILDDFRKQLADEVRSRDNDTPHVETLNISPWLAMSLMQKAIRRGREDLALRAATTLLKLSPDRLWRRICITAFEDVGIADFDTVAIVTAAMKGKRWRAELGGEWAVASYLVTRTARTIKCRSADDLAFIAGWHPAFEKARLDLTFRPVPELLDQIVGRGALPERAIALWYAIGTYRCPSPELRERRGDPQSVFDALCERGYPETVVEVAREGLKKCGEILAPFLILLWREAQRSARHVEPDNLPDEAMIGEVPCWAYDMHVREGNRAMARFLETECETTRWIADRFPRNKRVRFIGNMLFFVESGLVDRRLKWETGDRLRQMAELECHGLDPKDMEIGYALLRRELPMLNEERRHVAGPNLR
jgi:hypothetical protein